MRVHYEFTTALSPREVVAALTDFSERRPETWPGLDRARYQVHGLGETWALVTEGSRRPNVWARERYDWSVPGTVSWRVEASNFCGPPSGIVASVSQGPRGGSRVLIHGTHPDHRKRLPGGLRGASRQGQGPRVQVSPGQVGGRAQPRGPKGGLGLRAASRGRQDRRAAGRCGMGRDLVRGVEQSGQPHRRCAEHLRLTRVVQDPRTGDQVAPSAHRPRGISVSGSRSRPSISTVGERGSLVRLQSRRPR